MMRGIDKVKIIKGTTDIKEIIKLPKVERDQIILNIYNSTGASIRQLSRVMGLGRNVIANAVKCDKR